MDIARAQAVGIKNKEDSYRRKAFEFVRDAQHSKVEELMSNTSSLTISYDGVDDVRRNYIQNVIPAFRKSKVDWKYKGNIIYDTTFNPGFDFSGIAYGKKSFTFYISVFEENGRLVIANIRKKPEPPGGP